MTAVYSSLFLVLTLTASAQLPSASACIGNEIRQANQAACVGQPMGTLVAYPGNCTLYLVCNCEYPTVMPCAPGTWFNDKSKICDWPQNTDCDNREGTTSITIPTTTTAKATTTTTTTTATQVDETNSPTSCPPPPIGVNSALCYGSLSGTHFPYPHNCSAYVECRDDCALLKYCPTDKVFNAALNVCDTPDAVNCMSEPSVSMPTTEAITTPEINDLICRNSPSYQLLPYAADCSKYIECLMGKAYLHSCPLDRYFNPVLLICDFPEDVNCNATTTMDTTLPATTVPNISTDSTLSTPALGSTTPVTTEYNSTEMETSSETIVGTTSATNERCTGKLAGTTLPYVDDCSFYYYCSGTPGNGIILSCPKSNYYNPLTGKCGPEVASNACQLTFTTTTQTPEELCSGKIAGTTFPYTDNCEMYYYCTLSATVLLLSCPYNNYYNPYSGKCGPDVAPLACRQPLTTTTVSSCSEELADNVPVEDAKCPPTGNTAVTPPTIVPPKHICANASLGTSFPYPLNCAKYIVCEDPIPVAYYCPNGEEFNAELQLCGSPENSNCTTSFPSTLSTSTTAITSTNTNTEAPLTTASTELPTTGTNTTMPSTDNPNDNGNICCGKSHGVRLAFPGFCRRYIVCSYPVPIIVNCPESTVFNEHTLECSYSATSKCDLMETVTAPFEMRSNNAL